jgi:hypothetical protein
MRDAAVTLPLEEAKLVADLAHAAAVEHPSKAGKRAIEAVQLVRKEIREVERLAR